MEMETALSSLLGGVLIGIAVTVMLFFNGRVTGISGIINGFLTSGKDRYWQGAFIFGLLAGGLVFKFINPAVFANATERSLGAIAVAGLLVGFGTIMGSGCTSGHGVCGVSRMSVRSLIATGAFMVTGALAVAVVRFIFGGSI